MAMPKEIVDVIQRQEDDIDDELYKTSIAVEKEIRRDVDGSDARIKAILLGFGVALYSIIEKTNINLTQALVKLSNKNDDKYLSSVKNVSNSSNIVQIKRNVKRATDEFLEKFADDFGGRKSFGRTTEYRIKSVVDGATKTVRNIVYVGTKAGKSARQIADDVAIYIRPTEEQAKISPLSWYRNRFKEYNITQVKGVPSGSVSYNAFMIARTETNKTYRDSTVELGQNKEWVYGYKWNLSASHPRPDICDVWAEQDNGMGAGVYDSSSLPYDHPNGLCYVTEVVVSPREFRRYLDGEKLEKPKFTGSVPDMNDWLKAKKGVSEEDAIKKLLR